MDFKNFELIYWKFAFLELWHCCIQLLKSYKQIHKYPSWKKRKKSQISAFLKMYIKIYSNSQMCECQVTSIINFFLTYKQQGE